MASPSPGRRSKKKTRPITVEDLFSSVSAKKAYGSFAPPPSYALTPRSAEACLQTGVDPEDLRIRDLDSFWEPDLDPARQSMRHESYCERRHGLVKMLRRSRNGIMASEEQGRKQKASSSKHSDPIANARGDEGGGQLEIERRRLDKVRRRQQKEIEQMLAFEMKMAQIQEGANAKLEVEAKKNLLRLKEEKMRQKKMQQGKRMKSMKKQAEMELEEKRRRQLAHRAYVKDAQLEEERKRKAVELKRHAKQVEVDRQRKAEEHKLQTARIIQQQADEVEGKLQEMQENERKRVRLMAEKKEARAKQMEQMRRAIEKRQAENARQLKRIDHDRKAAFDHKQRVTLERQRRMAMDEAMQAEQKRKLTELQERKRLAVVEESAREEELRIHGMLAKFSTMDVNLNHVTAQKNRQNELKKERLRLKQEVKRANVEQQRRIDEYNRLQTLRKLQSDMGRTEKLLDNKAYMIEQRKQAAIATKKQRDTIQGAMAKLRLTKKWDKAQASLSSTLFGPGGDGGGDETPSRKGMKNNPMAQSAPQLPRGDDMRQRDPLSQVPPRPAGGMPRALENREPQPKQYISPYEMAQSPIVSLGEAPADVPAFANNRGDGVVTL